MPLALGITLPLAWRRVRPDLVLVVSGSAELGNVLAGYRPGFAWLAVVFAVYNFGANRSRRTEFWPIFVWVAEAAAMAAFAPHPNDPWYPAGILAASALAWVRGDWAWSRREEEERARSERARMAVADERTRIARELHDVVAHALGVIVMQAGGAGAVARLEDAQAKRVLATIERTGRQAFAEMRRLVGVLRDDDSDPALEPAPGVTALPELIVEMEAAGLAIVLEIEGEPCLGAEGAQLSAYRIVQEALTNTLKHVGPTQARVRVVWSADSLQVEVVDDGPRDDFEYVDRPAADRGGYGLVGMRERVAVYGGELHTGRTPSGGFRVLARLPLVQP